MERTPKSAVPGAVAAAILVVCLSTAALLFGAPPTGAAPTEPTLDLAGLQAKLDDSGTIPGYFKTVLSGSTIETIPMTVLAIQVMPNPAWGGVPDQLILFEATGPAIARIGGIAAGMSGSPLFVDDGGTDKLIGALSYGDIFTMGGLGLATPIQYMAAIETDHDVTPVSMRLSKPVETSAGTVDTIVIAPSEEAAKTLPRGAKTSVMTPKDAMFIGGIPAGSKAFKILEKRMADKGIKVKAVSGSLGSAWDPGFETTLTGGAAAAVMLSRGSLWAGGVGTVTYATTGTLLAFGHPMEWSGATGLSLTNAWVHGIWGSSLEPYKLASPTQLRGEVTQDRIAGVAARLDRLPDETAIAATATYTDESIVATTTSLMTGKAIDRSGNGVYPAISMYMAAAKATDAFMLAGSAESTLTVVVTGGGATHTVQRVNMWDNAFDVPFESIYENWDILEELTANPDGIADAHIASVDLEHSITSERRVGRVVDLRIPGGIVNGENRVEVDVLRYGVVPTETVEMTLTVPTGVPTNGRVSVGSESFWSDFGGDMYYYVEDFADGSGGAPRRTLAATVDGINDRARNNDMGLTFSPEFAYDDWWWYYMAPSRATARKAAAERSAARSALDVLDPIDVMVRQPWVVQDRISKRTPAVMMYPSKRFVSYGTRGRIRGVVSGLSDDITVTLTRTTAGSAPTTWAVPAKVDLSGDATFAIAFLPLAKSTTFTATWEGDDSYLAGYAHSVYKVRPQVRAWAAPRTVRPGVRSMLTARVRPSSFGGRVRFERLTRVGWRPVTSWRNVNSAGVASTPFVPRSSGPYLLRARTTATASNLAGASSAFLLFATP